MELILLMGSLLVFANSINPDIKSDTVQLEFSHYSFEEDIRVTKKGRETSFTTEGVNGIGGTLQTRNIDWKNWVHTLNARYYRGPDYRMFFYTTGIDYVVVRPRTPFRLLVGTEVGIGQLEIDGFRQLGNIENIPGWEVHAGLQSHFIAFDRLWNYYVRPTFRRYQFRFEGDPGVENETLNGNAFVLSAGIGIRF